MKSGKNFDRAEKLMRDLLKDSANQENLKIHSILCDALRKQYEAGNMKMYLKQKVDTAQLFHLTRTMFTDFETLDSLDARPNKKGEVKPRYRDKNAQFLNTYRMNLFNGGVFFIRKQDYLTAYKMFDMYIDCAQQPLFTSYHYPDSPEAAYWTVFCGYKMQDADLALKYADMALEDTAHLEFTYEYLAEIYKKQDDRERYVQALRDGFFHYKDNKYFFTYLIDHYNAVQQSDSAMHIVDAALEHDANSELFLFAKSNLLLNTGRYDECIALCDTMIARNDSLADFHYNAGVAYMNQAFIIQRDQKMNAKTRKKVSEKYNKAKNYMERYRLLAPDQKDKWAAALYNIYLQLNMGKQFEEIDKLLR
jgi:tetratricopeptide (TPR) repeat protein